MRVSTNDGYLEPARGRLNLTIQGDVLVDRVEFDGLRAAGVRARLDGEWRSLSAGEVILSAGAVHSPAILQRSGVGPAEHLRLLGITPRVDLPVGDNLLDHPIFYVSFKLRPAARVPEPSFRHTNCCVRYSSGLAGAGTNNMILLAMNVSGFSGPALAYGRIGVSAFQAWSQGTLRITTPDPTVDPQLDENMFADQRDLVRMRDGVRRLLAIVREPAATALCADGAFKTGMLGSPIEELVTDAQIDAALMAEVGDAQHGTGTCRMGRPDDPRSAVDPECRVLGVVGLRVIDAAIMPEVTRSNTHLPTVMIAEHMARRLVDRR